MEKPEVAMDDYEKLRKENELLKKKKAKLWKAIIATVLIAMLVIIIVIFVKTMGDHKSEAKIEELEAQIEENSDLAAVYEQASEELVLDIANAEISAIGELVTAEYIYTDVGKYTKSDEDSFFSSFTERSFISQWDGTIKAGIQIDGISFTSDYDNHTLTVFLPEAEILSNEIDPESFETYVIKDGLFSEVTPDDIHEFEAESKKAMQEKAIERGLLTEASENAQIVIRELLLSHPEICNDYEIVFEKK